MPPPGSRQGFQLAAPATMWRSDQPIGPRPMRRLLFPSAANTCRPVCGELLRAVLPRQRSNQPAKNRDSLVPPPNNELCPRASERPAIPSVPIRAEETVQLVDGVASNEHVLILSEQATYDPWP